MKPSSKSAVCLTRLFLSVFAALAVILASPALVAGENMAKKIDTQHVDAALSELVTGASVIGVSAMVYAGNQEIYYGQFGQSDREANRPWQRDTLVTLNSMTKPITGVALMSLYEEGLFDLDAPLSKYLPEFSNMQVITGFDDAGAPILESAIRPIKVIDIFRQTACFGYGGEDHPAAAFMIEAQVLDSSKPLSQFSQELSGLPLYCHPGEQWKYGVAVDVQARLAEVVSGQNYADIVQERVLGPLGMTDTRYFTPAEDLSRLAAVYAKHDGQTLKREADNTVYGFQTEKPVQINGGHGLVSTIDDYMRFALMLQNEGAVDGVQILRPETVALMSRDHLPPGITEKDFLPSKGQMGFGLDFAVRIAPPADEEEPFGVVGEFFWDGAASPLFWVDPSNDVTVVFLTQVLPFDLDAQKVFRRAVYEALDLVD